MRRIIFPALMAIYLVGCSTMAQNDQKKASTDSADTGSEKDQASYALGVSIGENLKKQDLTDLNYDQMVKGIEDAKNGTATLDARAAQMKVQEFQQSQKALKYAGNLKKSEDFLAKNASENGVKTTASGLQYRVIKEGSGARPTTADKVTVHYSGTLVDGTPFDSSRKPNPETGAEEGKPATFGVTQVIKGWTEGLQLMKEGAVYEFFIHPDLGYGVNPRPGVIKPNDALVFNVELIKIN